MIEEKSAGAVVFNEDSGITNFLLLNYPAGHWDFPKGNIEKGEGSVETVRREISEETGITNIEIIPSFSKSVKYYYRRSTGLVRKKVIYLLVRAKTVDVTLSHEHINYAWLELENAIKRVTYRNSKNILREAAKYLDKDSIQPGEISQ